MVNIKIGLATDSMSFTPTETYQSNNGYAYTFSNGQPFTDVIEQGTPSISTGYTYGSSARTNTFKCKACASMIQIKELEQYNNIVVYKDGALVFCGYNPTFSKNIKKGVGADGRKESWVEASISFDDYSAKLKDRKFSSSEDFDLYYTSADNVYVCNVDNTAKSLVHILLGYLFPSGDFTVHIGSMPSVLKTTKVTYFSVNYDDKVLSVIKDVFEQAGLAYYIVNRHFYVIDVLETMSGTAVNIPNIEEDAVKKGRSFVELKIPEIKMATARIAEDVRVYDSGDMQIEGKDWAWEPDTYYPADDMYAEGSYTCEKKDDDHPNGKADDEKEKRYFNIREREWDGEISWFTGNGAFLDYFSHDKKGVKYRIRNSGVLRRSWRLSQKADVLLFRYATGFKPAEWDGEDKECDYIFSTEMAQRYANALMYQKKTEALYYEFYADVLPSYPNGFPINTVVSLQGTDETNPLLIITSKTDKFDEFGGYVYKAVPYDRAGVSLSPSYVESKETMPASDQRFTLSLSRDVIECYSNRTPRDTTAVRVTVNVRNKLVTPELKVAGTTVAMERERVQVTVEGGTDWAETDNWIYDIDPNLNGYDTCQIEVTVNGVTVERTISKLVPNDGLNPDIIVPAGWVLVRQYCYGDENAPDPRFVEDADDTLEDADDIVSDIWWTDEVSGHCPLRPRNGYYIWMRQGIYDPETQTEPSTWTISLYDTPYLRFDCSVSTSTYLRNMKNPQGTPTNVAVIPDIVGYVTTQLVPYTSYGTLVWDAGINGWTLDIPQNVADDNITVGIVLGNLSKYFVLSVNDITQRNEYFGVYPRTEGSTTYNVPSDDSSKICLVGDRYLKTDGTPMSLVSVNGSTYSWEATDSKEAWSVMLDDALANPSVTLDNNSSFVIWIANLAVKDAFIRNLMTQKLQVQNGGYIFGGAVTLDNNGVPVKQDGRYVIDANVGGFVIDSTGRIEACGGYFENIEIGKNSIFRGNLEIYAEDGTLALKSAKQTQPPLRIKASKQDGVSTPTAYDQSQWYPIVRDWINSNFSTDTTYSLTNSTFGGSTVTKLRKSSGASETLVYENYTPNPHTAGVFPVFTNNTGKSVKVKLYVYACHTEGMFGIDRYYSAYKAELINSSGTVVSTPLNVASAKSDNVTDTASISVSDGYSLRVTINGGGGQTFVEERGHVKCWYNESAYFSSGINFYVSARYSTGWYHISSMTLSGILAGPARIECSDVGTNELVFSSSASWPVDKYYTFAFDSGYAPTNTEKAGTSLLSSYAVQYPYGTSKTVTNIAYSSTVLDVGTSDIGTVTFNVGSYVRSHSIDITVASTVLGLQVQNLLPLYDGSNNIIGGNVGSAEKPFDSLYSRYINGVPQSTSKRSTKTNIEPYNDDALAIIKRTGIVSFNYKFEIGTDRCWTHYGFIADDTDEELATPNHDVMDMGSCVGIMMKAIQQLSAEIEYLKGVINGR